MKSNVSRFALLVFTLAFLPSVTRAELVYEENLPKRINRTPAPVARDSGLSPRESRAIQQIARESDTGKDGASQAFEDAVISCVAQRVADRMEQRVKEREALRTEIKQEDSNDYDRQQNENPVQEDGQADPE
jgi:hypothetical protein